MNPEEQAEEIRNNLNTVEFLKDFDGMDDDLLKEISIVVADALLKEAKMYNSDRESFWFSVKSILKNK